MHLHIHVIPRYEDGPSMVEWEPKTAEPEELRETARLIQEKL